MSETHPQQRKHLFGSSYQGYEHPDGMYIRGAKYAPDPRPIWKDQQRVLQRSWDGLRVLDLAGNNGYHAIKALREGARSAKLVELHRGAAEKARWLASEWGVDLDVVYGDIEKVSWQNDGPYDVVFCHQVVYHLECPVQLLRRVREAMIQDGFLFMYTRLAAVVHERHWEWVPNWESMCKVLRYLGFREPRYHTLDGRVADAIENPALDDKRQVKVLVSARA